MMPSEMTTADQIRDLARASRLASEGATPGEWTNEPCDIHGIERHIIDGPPGVVGEAMRHHDAEHIAHHNPTQTARTAALLEALAEVVEGLEELRPVHVNDCSHLKGTAHYRPYCSCGAHGPMKAIDALLAKIAEALK